MSDKKKTNSKKRPSTGSVQSLDTLLSSWIERQFRGEKPTSIDAYPLHKGRDRELRKYHYDVKGDETISAERAVELANEIFSDCQVHCDALPQNALYKGTKTYEISVIDDRRGGIAKPVGSYVLTLEPRVHRPAPSDGEEADALEGDEALSARRIMLESVKLIHERDRVERDNEGKIVGDTMVLMKEALSDREALIKDMFAECRGMIGEFRGLARDLAERRVEERAVAIDDANAAENRRDQAARRDRENMWADVAKAGMLEGVQLLGKVLPGIGSLFMAQMTGKPMPEPPQLTGAGPAPAGQPQLPAVPEEKTIIDRFIAAAEAHRIDADHTAAERLFGKDDDKTGAIIEPGVFKREQVAILSGVHTGKLGVEALDALLPDSGKPEAISIIQGVQAMAFLTPDMRSDLDRFMTLRKAKRGAN